MSLIERYRTPQGTFVVCRQCGKPMTGHSKDIPNPAYQFHTACNPHNPEAVARVQRKEEKKQAFFDQQSQQREEDKVANPNTSRTVWVQHKGQVTRFETIVVAFKTLGLTMNKHIAFRAELKANRVAKIQGHTFYKSEPKKGNPS